MKGLLLSLFIAFTSLYLKAQLIDPAATKWFELDNFFSKDAIAEQGIAAIHIKIDEKKDGEIIREKGDFLHYEFDAEGNLTQSLKNIRLANRIDTLENLYTYNDKGQLIEKNEIHPPFHFSFHYQFKENRPIKEIKIDESKPLKDTVQQHLYSYKIQENGIIKETTYTNGLPFKKEQIRFGQNGRITSRKLSYQRGGAYRHTLYHYENNQLKKVRLTSRFSKKSERFKQFFYKEAQLNEVLIFEEGKRTHKLAVTYKKNGLIEAIIERDFWAKKIKIYYFLYSKSS